MKQAASFVVLQQLSQAYLCNMIQFKSTIQSKEFSAMVPDVVASISYNRAVVSVTVSKSGDSQKIFEEYMYPDANDEIRLSDIDRLIERFAAQWLVFGLTVKVTEQNVTTDSDGGEVISGTTTDSVSTTVVSCKANVLNITAAQFCDQHFLTLLDGPRQTAEGFLEYLYFVGSGSPSCTAYYADGTSRSFSVDVLRSTDYYMLDASPVNFLSSGKELIRYVVSAGNRRQEYLVVSNYDPDIAPALLFFNSFGVQELAYCMGEHQQVASFNRKQTRIGREKVSYQVDETKRFKADTGILSFPMANWWNDVLRSKDIRVLPIQNGGVVVGEGLPVVIVSEKSELSNAPDELPRITFEYEYADRNHNILDLRREGRIFDNTFDNTFN